MSNERDATTSSVVTAFSSWVSAHTAEMVRYAAARVKEAAVAEDLVQQTFLSAWEARERFAGNSSPRTWLFSILKNKLADHYRKAYRDPIVHGVELIEDVRFDMQGRWRPEHMPHPWEQGGKDDPEAMQRYLFECLGHLPGHLRSAVEMKYLKQQDAEAICQELGITPTNYWQQLHRAKVKLRDCITHLLATHQ